jgi:hypothetical protein
VNHNVDGVDFPLSIHAVGDGRRFRYVKPPTNSFDWAGADWESPVSLTFQTETVTAEQLSFTVTLHGTYEYDADAAYALRNLRKGLNLLALGVRESDKLVDPVERVRMRTREGQVQFRAKVWPAIAGITFYAEDDTR